MTFEAGFLRSDDVLSDPEAERIRCLVDWSHCDSSGYQDNREECTRKRPTCRIHVVQRAVEQLLAEAAESRSGSMEVA